MKVFSGIQTRKGYDLCLQIVRDLRKGNQQKVYDAVAAGAIEWYRARGVYVFPQGLTPLFSKKCPCGGRSRIRGVI